MGVPILGTAADGVDAAEDREKFDEILQAVRHLRVPQAGTVFTTEEAMAAAEEIGYPVLRPPSAMFWADRAWRSPTTSSDIEHYMQIINRYESGTPHSGGQIPHGHARWKWTLSATARTS